MATSNNDTITALSKTTTAGLSDHHVGWVAPPRQRGTINIIWSCLAVLLICSYKCIHLNIPAEDERQAGFHKWKGIPYWPERPRLRKALRKLKYMLIVILAPEAGVGMAIKQRRQASQELANARTASEEFTSSGFSSDEDEQASKSELTMSHAYYATMGGFVLRASRASLSEYVTFLRECDPKTRRTLFLKSTVEIDNLGKSDSFTKVLAISQAAWLAVQCCARVAAGLPISLLELSTAGYIVCAVAMYLAWWEKPYDAEHVTVLYRTGEAEEPNMSLDPVANADGDAFSIIFVPESIRNGQSSLALYLIATLFGALHLAAWNWEFPSKEVQWLWRASSLAITTTPFIIACFMLLVARNESGSWGVSIGASVSLTTTIIYVLARLVIVVLVVYSLWNMPSRMYETVSWTDHFPFFS